MKTRFLTIIGIVLLLPTQLVFAEPLEPEPSPICPAGTMVKNNVCVIINTDCGKGATYQDGLCVVDETEEKYAVTSNRWGGPTWNTYVKSPLKQFKSGISIDEIQCEDGLVNIIKISNGLPACVKPDTKEKLMQIGWATEPMFYGLTKPQITDIQHAKLGCKKTGNQTYCNEMIKEKTEYYLQQNALDTNPESVTENCEECKLYGCADNEVYFRGICMTPEAKEKAESVGETKESTVIYPDSQGIVVDEHKGGNDYGITTNMVFSYSEYPSTDNLDAVLRSCENSERVREANFTLPDGTKYASTDIGYMWFNSTHYIDNNICHFIPTKKYLEDKIISAILEYCDSTSKIGFDNPYEYWFANETHYIDSDTCLWQHLDDDIALVLPDHWKNTYAGD